MEIYLKNKNEVEKLRNVNLIVAAVLDACEAACKPGVTTWELNEIADAKMKSLGATSAFLGYHNYPAVLCTSVNEVIVHGVPRKDLALKEGDIIGIDFGCFKDGFCGDAARTVAVGKISEDAQKLIDATRQSLELAISQCKPGNRLQDIGHAVQSHVEPLGYSVVRNCTGHGIGRAMHEDPPVPNYGKRGMGLRLKPGLTLAIEPMVNVGTPETEILSDGWTLVTKDRKLSAHFEHSIVVTDGEPIVLSRP